MGQPCMAVACLAMLHPVLQKQVGGCDSGLLAMFALHENSLKVLYLVLQKKVGGTDCGLFALAYAARLARSTTRACVNSD